VVVHNTSIIVIQVNVEKVLERDQKLSQLDDRADALQVGVTFVFINVYRSLSEVTILRNLGRSIPVREVGRYAEAKVLVEEYQDDHNYVCHCHPLGHNYRSVLLM
jgi:hypothetical protein